MSIFILSFRDLPGNIKHTENDRKDQAQQTDDDCQKCEKFRQCHATSPLSAQDLRGRKLSKVPTRGPVSCETDFRARSQPPAFLTQRSYRHFWRQHQYSIRIDKEQLKIVPFSSFFARKIVGTYSLTTQPKGVTLLAIKQRCVMQKKEVFP